MATKRLHYINTPDDTFTVHSTNDRVTFYDFDTDRTYTRVRWVDCAGFEYVRMNRAFQALSLQALHEGMKITVGEYV